MHTAVSLNALWFQSPTSCLASGRAGSCLICVRAWWGPSATRTAWATPGTEIPQRLSPSWAPPPSPPASSSAWTTISTRASPGPCRSANPTRPYWLTSKGTRASPRGWWRSTPRPGKRSCSTPSSGGWGSTSWWIRPCPWAPGPDWWAGCIRSSLGCWPAWSPSLSTRWGGPTPTTPRFWCGGRGEGLRLSSYHPNKSIEGVWLAESYHSWPHLQRNSSKR